MLSAVSRYLATIFLSRRSLSATLLLVYVVTAAGVPIPVGGIAHTGELYPCASHACGCPDAEHCWRSCCCFTLAERFDWAREHNVRPPEYAIAAAKDAGVDLCWLGIESVKHLDDGCPYCARKVVAVTLPSCCQTKGKSCCEHSAHACCQNEQKQNKKSDGDYIVAWRALACHGQSMNWLAAVPSLIVPASNVSYGLPRITWLGAAVSDTASCIPSFPSVPPPECA
jgi:hypothetical protein